MRLPLISLILALSSSAYGNFLSENPDCAFFEKADLEGAYWTSRVGDKDPNSAQLDTWWQDRATSVYVKSGYVFEAYSEKNFSGRSLALDAQDPIGEAYGQGAIFDLRNLEFAGQLSSFRCRPRGEELAFKAGRIFWFEGQRYNWRSGGNHPDHRWLEMQTINGERVLRIHADNTYGINRQDYLVNLSKESVHVEFVQSGMTKASTDFDLQMGLMRDDYRLMVLELREHVKAIAMGRAQDPWAPEPPKPELLDLVDYFSRFIKNFRR